jgi:beta-1,4-mannosyl-glycoprotein beta-1,4-N-acetylglucosaminyltransferase
MKIVDCFPYFNEKELLELRINLLYDHVDKFIICDADRTHSGKPKPFLCKDVIRELNLPQEKIQVVEVNLPEKSTNPWVSGTWIRERMQRNAASQFIENDDVCFVGDCDEIIDPKYIKYYASIAREHPHNILRVPLVLLTGRADLRVCDENETPREWNTSYFCLKSHLQKYTLSDIREARSLQKSIDFPDIFATENNQIVESGWHFTWMGDMNRIKTKCSSFLHHDEVKVVDGYEAKINSTDPLGRTDHILKNYPKHLLPIEVFKLENVKNFLLPKRNDGFVKEKISVIQVGTNQAKDDLAYHLLCNYESLELGIFVEPNKFHNPDIKKCYEKYDNVIIENIAIKPSSVLDNHITLYFHDHDGGYGFQVTSCSLDHINKHYPFGKVYSFEVPCLSLEELLDKHSIIFLDWLLLDIEGIDAEVILSFNWEKYEIKRVEFEYIHLGDKAEIIKQKFLNMGYKEVEPLHMFDWAFIK